jgi:hypothetical protein
MGLVPIWSGRVNPEGTALLFETSQAPQRKAYLKTLAGKEIEVVVRRKRRPRSVKQNSYLHVCVFPPLAAYFGLSIEDAKYELLGECFGRVFNAKLGREVPVKPHTSDLTIEETSTFIEWVIPWALTLPSPVVLPLPGEAEAA